MLMLPCTTHEVLEGRVKQGCMFLGFLGGKDDGLLLCLWHETPANEINVHGRPCAHSGQGRKQKDE